MHGKMDYRVLCVRCLNHRGRENSVQSSCENWLRQFLMLPDSPGSMHGADALLRRLEKGKCYLSLHGVESTDLHISCPFPGTFEFGNSFFFCFFFFFVFLSMLEAAGVTDGLRLWLCALERCPSNGNTNATCGGLRNPLLPSPAGLSGHLL